MHRDSLECRVARQACGSELLEGQRGREVRKKCVLAEAVSETFSVGRRKETVMVMVVT